MNDQFSFLEFDNNKLILFKSAHKEALKSGVDEFTFDGLDFSVSYAGYLIEYLEPQIKSDEQ